ncbi:C40 family peptidase [Pedobacter hartonius]|uniref:CHAP domain-containing protein n=1 Tax=Pedobacter hartonius TaxID=425514 RepID=A0A1H4BUQ5_9SPHI|nr:C40 family peptidase [Pedobacter hartonius]SEA51824.1 hypothetical protein SAMN05443550_103474 [Pedobacter hartonius]
MATTRLLLGILCSSFIGGFGVLKCHLLVQNKTAIHVVVREQSCRIRLVDLAIAEIGIREKTGKNDGKRVEAYLSVVNLKKGQPYCSAFISWLFAQEGFARPRSGWSPDLFPSSRLSRYALPANIIGIYFPDLKRIAHVGIIERLNDQWCYSIEANTNLDGGRNGDGVYRRVRHLKTIYRISDWVSPERRVP